MNKEESLKVLADGGVDVSLTKDGEIRVDLLRLAAEGLQAKGAKETYESTIDTLNQRIEDLEKQKTPAEKADRVHYKKEKKVYRMRLPVVRFENQKVDAELLNKDQSLLERLLATKTSLLVEEEKGG